MLVNSLKNLVYLGIFVCGLVIITLKIYPTAFNNSYLLYGLDTPRAIGDTLHLLTYKHLGPFTVHRYGLPLTAGLLNTLLNLPPSQIFLPIFYLINLGAVIGVWYITHVTFKSQFVSALSSLLFATNFVTVQPNASHFAGLLLVPLRVGTLFWLFQQTSLTKKFLAILTLHLFSIPYLFFSYQLYGFLLDCMVLPLLLLHYKKYTTSVTLILLTQLATFFISFLIFQSQYNFSANPIKIVDRTFSISTANTNTPPYLTLIITALAIQFLILIIMLLKPEKLKKITPTKFFFSKPVQIYFSLFSLFTRPLVLLLLFLYIENKFSFSRPLTQLYIFKNFSELGFTPIFSLAILGICLNPTSYTKSSILGKYLLIISFVYILLFQYLHLHGISNLLRNSRFEIFFSMFLYPTLGWGLSHLFKAKILTALFIIIAVSHTYHLSRQSFTLTPNQLDLQAFDWLSQQPNKNLSLFYTAYFDQPNHNPVEKIFGLYFIPSQIPYQDQYYLATCQTKAINCIEIYTEYIIKHQIKYLVLEDYQPTPIFEQLSLLGNTIYDNKVRIIQIF